MLYLYGLLTIPAVVILWAIVYNIYLITPYAKRKENESFIRMLWRR